MRHHEEVSRTLEACIYTPHRYHHRIPRQGNNASIRAQAAASTRRKHRKRSSSSPVYLLIRALASPPPPRRISLVSAANTDQPALIHTYPVYTIAYTGVYDTDTDKAFLFTTPLHPFSFPPASSPSSFDEPLLQLPKHHQQPRRGTAMARFLFSHLLLSINKAMRGLVLGFEPTASVGRLCVSSTSMARTTTATTTIITRRWR